MSELRTIYAVHPTRGGEPAVYSAEAVVSDRMARILKGQNTAPWSYRTNIDLSNVWFSETEAVDAYLARHTEYLTTAKDRVLRAELELEEALKLHRKVTRA